VRVHVHVHKKMWCEDTGARKDAGASAGADACMICSFWLLASVAIHDMSFHVLPATNNLRVTVTNRPAKHLVPMRLPSCREDTVTQPLPRSWWEGIYDEQATKHRY
jgi:hypothetical protein